MAAKRKITLAGVAARLLFSLTLVFATYNPTGYSVVHWLLADANGFASLRAIVVILLLILYGAIFRVVYASFRQSGLIAASFTALLFSLFLVVIAFPTDSASSVGLLMVTAQYVLLLSVSLVIASGISWAHVMERLTGQLSKRYVRYGP